MIVYDFLYFAKLFFRKEFAMPVYVDKNVKLSQQIRMLKRFQLIKLLQHVFEPVEHSVLKDNESL